MEVINMDKKTLQEIVKRLRSKKEELTIKLIRTTDDVSANRRIGQLDMTIYFIEVLEDEISKIEEP